MRNEKINSSITANFFLKRGREEEVPITLMKLLKLVFLAHGWAIAILDDNEGVLDGEEVEAWIHGPVIPSLYHEFKCFNGNPIDRFSLSTVEESDNDFELKSVFIEKSAVPQKKKFIYIFSLVWEAYKKYSAWGLREITHAQNSPWSQTYKSGEKNIIIPNELIKTFYKGYLEEMANHE